MRFALAIPVVALASSTVAGARSLGDVFGSNLIRARSFGHHLFDARQTPNVPTQCQPTCNPVLSTINNVRWVGPYIL